MPFGLWRGQAPWAGWRLPSRNSGAPYVSPWGARFLFGGRSRGVHREDHDELPPQPVTCETLGHRLPQMSQVTDLHDLIVRSTAGDMQARAELFAALYQELHKRARSVRRRLGPQPTVDTTDILHSVIARLLDPDSSLSAADLDHFLAILSTAMRNFLHERYRGRSTAKRGGGVRPEPLKEPEPALSDPALSEEWVDLRMAFKRLSHEEPKMFQVAILLWVFRCTREDVARMCGVSVGTIKKWMKHIRSQLLIKRPEP